MTEPAAERQSTEVPAERASPAESAVESFAPQTLLLQLQRTAGNLAVARAVVRARSIQRQALDPADIIAAVESSKYLKGKLKSSTSTQQRPQEKERMRDRVKAILDRYEDMFGGAATDNAVMLALAIDGAAAVIADELYDPGLKSKISEVLFTVYGPKIRATLAKKHGLGKQQASKALATAKALGSGDPVSLYMHEEMQLEHAAFEVAAMAKRAQAKPEDMFELLSQRYQAELASYTFKELGEREHKGTTASGGAYKVSEATGEISQDFFVSLFGADVATHHTTRPKSKAGGLEFTPEAAAKLKKLRKAVEAGAGKDLPTTAGDRLRKQFEGLAAFDKTIAAGREARVKALLVRKKKDGGWELDPAKADLVIQKLKEGIPKLPLTITVWGKAWFGDRQTPRMAEVDPKYKAGTAAVKEQELAKLIGVKGTKTKKHYAGETLEHGGKYEHELYGLERGENYLRFRRWKDQLMTQSLGFKPEELPVYGAVNVNWATTWGTQGFGADTMTEDLEAREQAGEKLSKAQKQRLDQGLAERKRRAKIDPAKGEDIGINYYGDTHFVLEAEKLRGRVVYTATDHGRPHLDPFLAFADFVLGTDATEIYDGTPYRSDITRLKPGGVQKSPSSAVYTDVINAILDPANAPLVRRTLPFEIQIFGGIDLRTDVREICVSPAAPDGVHDNASAWAKAYAAHIKVRPIDLPDSSRIPVEPKALTGAASPKEKAQAAAAKV